ncbi:hypothetical protein [Streptomyces sp. NPDC087300]|uniref:hypothetical protein n=1 Tax=Streptomyces sp. NPDC087300 TaxID=3365780 RepID=UPI00381B85C4
MVLVLGLLVLALGGPVLTSYATEAGPAGVVVDRVVRSVDETARAGSRAGEGRVRPGRPESALPEPAVPVPAFPPREASPTPPSPKPERDSPGRRDTASDTTAPTRADPVLPGLRVLPLGGGLVLIGLGIGFLGLRLRRG